MMSKLKIITLFTGCILLLLTGTTYAYWFSEIAHTNMMMADHVQAEILEIFEQNTNPIGTVQKEVSFKNNSSSAVFLRVTYAESWVINKNESQYILSNQIDGEDVASKKWLNGFEKGSDLWEKGQDGWFYYKKILKAGENTLPILEYVVFPDYTGIYEEYQEAEYKLYFRMELLQASDSQSTLNSQEVNSAASSLVFGREAIVSSNGNVSWK